MLLGPCTAHPAERHRLLALMSWCASPMASITSICGRARTASLRQPQPPQVAAPSAAHGSHSDHRDVQLWAASDVRGPLALAAAPFAGPSYHPLKP